MESTQTSRITMPQVRYWVRFFATLRMTTETGPHICPAFAAVASRQGTASAVPKKNAWRRPSACAFLAQAFVTAEHDSPARSTALLHFLGGRSFSSDIKNRAKRLPFARPFRASRRELRADSDAPASPPTGSRKSKPAAPPKKSVVAPAAPHPPLTLSMSAFTLRAPLPAGYS